MLGKLISMSLSKALAEMFAALSRVAARHHTRTRDQIIANVLGTDSKKAAALAEELADETEDDVFNMDADQYEQYLARREGKPPYPRGV